MRKERSWVRDWKLVSAHHLCLCCGQRGCDWTCWISCFAGCSAPLHSEAPGQEESQVRARLLLLVFPQAHSQIFSANPLLLFYTRSARTLIICLIIRFIPAVIMSYSAKTSIGDVSLHQTIMDGLFLSILTSDVIIAKVANRPVHNLLVIFSIFTTINTIATHICLGIYYVRQPSSPCCQLRKKTPLTRRPPSFLVHRVG